MVFIGENGDSSLVVSLEINSVMYQGVLFAQPSKANNSKDVSSPPRVEASTAAVAATMGSETPVTAAPNVEPEATVASQ